MMVDLSWELYRILGDKSAKVLAKALDLHTVGDLLRHYPRRYVKRGDLTDLDALHDDEHVTVLARVKQSVNRKFKNRRGSRLEVVVTDGTGELQLVFFNQAWRASALTPGRIGMFAGKVSRYGRVRQLAHPEYELFPDAPGSYRQAAEDYAEKIIPVYPATEKLASWQIAKCVDVVINQIRDLDDPIPAEVL
ncbi:MAG: OB-fold nucleic acid binding domain-containing protein, partial [Jiangellaceae bacterium]